VPANGNSVTRTGRTAALRVTISIHSSETAIRNQTAYKVET
jgi:hypothetical protein